MRKELTNRRRSETFEFNVKGQFGRATTHYVATVGYFANGRIGEIFIRMGKAGSDMNIATLELSIAVSMALQAGVTPEEMKEAFPRHGTEPEGALGTLLDLITASGVQDAITEVLE